MRVATDWKDFALLDSGEGQKLERWGSVLLSRPDPQALWPKLEPGLWRKAQAIYHRSGEGGGQWEFKQPLPPQWELKYKDLIFKVKPTDFKHTGLFPEQAVNWDWMRERVQARGGKVSALNLFGYTGAATIALAKAGASVAHVDAAKGMVAWCKDNAAINQLGGAPIRYLVDDVIKFCRREIKRGHKFDAIVMDPPSYGRGTTGETWKIEKHLWPLLELCGQLLSEKPVLVLVNSYTSGLSPTVLQNLVMAITHKKGGQLECGEVGLPHERSERVLPCGVYARWWA